VGPSHPLVLEGGEPRLEEEKGLPPDLSSGFPQSLGYLSICLTQASLTPVPLLCSLNFPARSGKPQCSLPVTKTVATGECLPKSVMAQGLHGKEVVHQLQGGLWGEA
jgi:hypothetical protein